MAERLTEDSPVFAPINMIGYNVYSQAAMFAPENIDDLAIDLMGAQIMGPFASLIEGSGHVLANASFKGLSKFKKLFTKVDDAVNLVDNVADDAIKKGINFSDDFDDIVNNIKNINKKYSTGYDKNNPISSIVNSSSYYDDPYDQVAAIGRSISQHAFENGNKRTSFDTMRMLMSEYNLDSTITDDDLWNLIYDMSSSESTLSVSDIGLRLKGN